MHHLNANVVSYSVMDFFNDILGAAINVFVRWQ